VGIAVGREYRRASSGNKDRVRISSVRHVLEIPEQEEVGERDLKEEGKD